MRLSPVSSLLAALTLASALATPARAQESRRDNSFRWSGTIPAGRTITIRNVNGGIEVTRSTSGRVEVAAEKHWRRGNPAQVRIEPKTFGDDVVVCALFTEGASCEQDGIRDGRRTRWNEHNDVSVHFEVRVPEGVRVDLSTVNGSLEVGEVTTAVRAATVNGSIIARSAGGPVRAQTTNGNITVAMGEAGSTEELEYESVNGSITIELPATFGAQLELGTVNGSVTTEFPITVSGTLSRRRLRGTIGDGRTRLRASTVNGSVTLRKR